MKILTPAPLARYNKVFQEVFADGRGEDVSVEAIEQAMLDLDDLESLESFSGITGNGVNISSSLSIDSEGNEFENIVFWADTKFLQNGYVYFANGVFALSLREHFETLLEYAKTR